MSWRFAWRPDRLQRLHELGQEFDLTEDRPVTDEPQPENERDNQQFPSDDAGSRLGTLRSEGE